MGIAAGSAKISDSLCMGVTMVRDELRANQGIEFAEDDRDDDDDRDDLVGVEGRGEEDAPGGRGGQAEHDPGQEGPGVVTEQGHAQAADHGEGDAGNDQRELSHVAGHRAESGDDRIHGGADQHDDRGRDVDPDPREDCSGEQQEEARGPGDHRDDEPALALEEQRHGPQTQQQRRRSEGGRA